MLKCAKLEINFYLSFCHLAWSDFYKTKMLIKCMLNDNGKTNYLKIIAGGSAMIVHILVQVVVQILVQMLVNIIVQMLVQVVVQC